MRDNKLPEFTAATMPPPQQWEGKWVWREDIKAMQYSTGTAWVDLAAMQALVSGGGIAYADVATVAGTPGERRTLSDGPDAGAQLIWAIPEGATAYAWCWAIYPLAAYL